MYTLSRAVDPKVLASTEADDKLRLYVEMITTALPVTDGRWKMEIIRTETEKDTTLTNMKKTIINGWPNMSQDCSQDIT